MTDKQCYEILLAEQSKQIEELKGQIEGYKNELVQKNLADVNSTYDGVDFNGYAAAYEDFKRDIEYQTKEKGLVVDHIKLKMSAWGDNFGFFCDKLGIERGTHTYTDENGVSHTQPKWSDEIFSAQIELSSMTSAKSLLATVVTALKSFSDKINKIKFTYMDCMGCECDVHFSDCEFITQITLYAYNKDESLCALGLDYF